MVCNLPISCLDQNYMLFAHALEQGGDESIYRIDFKHNYNISFQSFAILSEFAMKCLLIQTASDSLVVPGVHISV